MQKNHIYTLTLQWTGNTGSGTRDYRSYERSHSIFVNGKQTILASSDPAFRGDASKYNPEEMLLASLASCHMLWFLHLCADNKIVIIDYIDLPTGIMQETENGGGKFIEITLNPEVTVLNSKDVEKLEFIHQHANKLCFIANSVNFPVKHKATVKVV